MKKNSTVKQSPKRVKVLALGPITIGLDLGDKTSRFWVLDNGAKVQAEGSVATTKKAMTQKFAALRRCRPSEYQMKDRLRTLGIAPRARKSQVGAVADGQTEQPHVEVQRLAFVLCDHREVVHADDHVALPGARGCSARERIVPRFALPV